MSCCCRLYQLKEGSCHDNADRNSCSKACCPAELPQKSGFIVLFILRLLGTEWLPCQSYMIVQPINHGLMSLLAWCTERSLPNLKSLAFDIKSHSRICLN